MPPGVPALELDRCATIIQARGRGAIARQQTRLLRSREMGGSNSGDSSARSSARSWTSGSRRRSSGARLLSREEKAHLEAVLSESIEPALCLPHPYQRLQYVSAVLLARATGSPPPDAPPPTSASPTEAEVTEVINFLKRAFEVALAEAKRQGVTRESPIARIALSLLRQAEASAPPEAMDAPPTSSAAASSAPSSSSDAPSAAQPSSSQSPAPTPPAAATAAEGPSPAGIAIPKLDTDGAAAAIQARRRGALARQQTQTIRTRRMEAEAVDEAEAAKAATPPAAAEAVDGAAKAPTPPPAEEATSSPGGSEFAANGDSNGEAVTKGPVRFREPSPAPSSVADPELEVAAASFKKELTEAEAKAKAEAEAEEKAAVDKAAADKADAEKAAWEAEKAAAKAKAAAMVAEIEAAEKAKAEASAEDTAAAEKLAAEKAAAETAAAEKAAAEKAAADKAARAAARAAEAAAEKDGEVSPAKRELLVARKLRLQGRRAKLHLVDDGGGLDGSSGGPPHDVRLSKLLSNVLRHHAVRVGLEMDKAGWITIKAVLEYLNHGPTGPDDGRWESLQGCAPRNASRLLSRPLHTCPRDAHAHTAPTAHLQPRPPPAARRPPPAAVTAMSTAVAVATAALDGFGGIPTRRLAVRGAVTRLVGHEGAHVVRVRSARARDQPAARRRLLPLLGLVRRRRGRKADYLLVDAGCKDARLVARDGEGEDVGLVRAEAAKERAVLAIVKAHVPSRVSGDDGQVGEQGDRPDERGLPPAL